jgi:hypothetical protein
VSAKNIRQYSLFMFTEKVWVLWATEPGKVARDIRVRQFDHYPTEEEVLAAIAMLDVQSDETD